MDVLKRKEVQQMQYKGYTIQVRRKDNCYIIRDGKGRKILEVENLENAWEQIDFLTADEKE